MSGQNELPVFIVNCIKELGFDYDYLFRGPRNFRKEISCQRAINLTVNTIKGAANLDIFHFEVDIIYQRDKDYDIIWVFSTKKIDDLKDFVKIMERNQ